MSDRSDFEWAPNGFALSEEVRLREHKHMAFRTTMIGVWKWLPRRSRLAFAML
jgi:hypothetical protein